MAPPATYNTEGTKKPLIISKKTKIKKHTKNKKENLYFFDKRKGKKDNINAPNLKKT